MSEQNQKPNSEQDQKPNGEQNQKPNSERNRKMNTIGCTIFCVFLLVGIAWVCVAVFSSLNAFKFFLVFLPCLIVGSLVLYFIKILWQPDKEQAGSESDEKRNSASSPKPSIPASSPLAGCGESIEAYLRENKSTPWFREKLNILARRVATFASRCENIREIITTRFGQTGLSYAKFAGPVIELQGYLIKLTDNLVKGMRVFNEEEYRSLIGEFEETGQTEKAAEYQELEKEYMAYVETVMAAFDDANLRLDRLMLELSRLGEADMEKALRIMHDLDEAIRDTKLYN